MRNPLIPIVSNIITILVFCLISLTSVYGTSQKTEYEFGYGLGYEDNIFYSSTNKESENFGFANLELDAEMPLTNTWQLDLDAVYEDKHFYSESEADDRFFSAFTEIFTKLENGRVGLALDPQYMQFITSDTDGGLVFPGKQRLWSNSVSVFASYDLNERNALEASAGLIMKDYKNSESDFDASIADLNYRHQLVETTAMNIGLDIEDRNYDKREARTATGTPVMGQTLEILRYTPYVRFRYVPDNNQAYSLKIGYRDNQDDFQGYFDHSKITFSLRAKYHFEGGALLKGSLRKSYKDYDAQTGDDGNLLEEESTSFKLEASVPNRILANMDLLEDSFWFTKFRYKDYESDLAEEEYENASVMAGLGRTF